MLRGREASRKMLRFCRVSFMISMFKYSGRIFVSGIGLRCEEIDG